MLTVIKETWGGYVKTKQNKTEKQKSKNTQCGKINKPLLNT